MKIRAILLCVLVAAGSAGAQPSAVWQAEVDRLFEEAQRYQLGIDRPLDVRKAYQLYMEVIRMAPEHVDAYYNLAALCFDQKRYDLAESYYRKVLHLRPEDADAINNLGTVSELRGRIGAARKFNRKAIEVDSTVAMAYYNYARLLSQDGKNEEAMALLEKAMALEPDNPRFVNQYTRLQGELGKLSGTTIGLISGGFVVVLAVFGLLNRKRKV